MNIKLFNLINNKREASILFSLCKYNKYYSLWLNKLIKDFDKDHWKRRITIDIKLIKEGLNNLIIESKQSCDLTHKKLLISDHYFIYQMYSIYDNIFNDGFLTNLLVSKITKKGLNLEDTLLLLSNYNKLYSTNAKKLELSLDFDIIELYEFIISCQKEIFSIYELLCKTNINYSLFKSKYESLKYFGDIELDILNSRLSDDYIYYDKKIYNQKSGTIMWLSSEATTFFEQFFGKYKKLPLISKQYRIYISFLNNNVLTIKQRSFDLPPRVYLELTNSCNLDCKFCFNRLSKREFELSLTDWKYIITKIPCNSEVTIFGGEPFLYSGIESILLDLCNNNTFNIRCFTNGILIDKITNVLKILPRAITIVISLDGIETHDLIRGEGAFGKTINTIKKIKSETSHKVFVKTVKTKELSDTELFKLLHLLDSIGVDDIKFGDLSIEGNAKKNKFSPLEFEQDYHFYKKINEIIKTLNHIKIHKDDFEYQPNYCGVGYRIVYFRCDGFVTGCTEITDIVSGITFELDLDKFNDLIPKIFKTGLLDSNSVCSKCGLQNLCLGGCRARAYRHSGIMSSCDLFRKAKIEYLLNNLCNYK